MLRIAIKVPCHRYAAGIVIANEIAINCMSLRTTVQILQVRRPNTGVGSQLAQSMLPDMGQTEDGQKHCLLPPLGAGHNKSGRRLSFVDRTKQPTVVADVGGRDQMLSTVNDNSHLLITHSIQLCVQRDGRLGVTASRGPSVLADTCFIR